MTEKVSTQPTTTLPEDKSPSYPWYPRDYNNDEPVQLMTLEAEGAYHRLLDHQWFHRSIPAGIPDLARVCKNVSPNKMRKLWREIAPCFVAVPGDTTRLYNRKLERIRAEKEAYRLQQSESGRLGARRRWEKYGNPNTNPNGDPIGVASVSPIAKPWPASTTTSTSASASRDLEEGDARAHEADEPITLLVYSQRCTGACNRGLRDNPAYNGGQFNELVTSSQTETARAWYEAGIPLDVAAGVILAQAAKYKPTPRYRQPHSIAYFDRPVRDEWERRQAAQGAGGVTPIAPASRAAAEGDEEDEFVRAGREFDARVAREGPRDG